MWRDSNTGPQYITDKDLPDAVYNVSCIECAGVYDGDNCTF